MASKLRASARAALARAAGLAAVSVLGADQVLVQMQMLATVPTKCMVLVLAVLCRCSGSGTAYQVLLSCWCSGSGAAVLLRVGHLVCAGKISDTLPSMGKTGGYPGPSGGTNGGTKPIFPPVLIGEFNSGKWN